VKTQRRWNLTSPLDESCASSFTACVLLRRHAFRPRSRPFRTEDVGFRKD